MKSVYTGGEKVAEFESYDELRVGDSKPTFIYEGSELVYPNPIKDGLVLWYDFSGRTNADGQRGIAEDLSGNGNHGTLQNFNYSAESGYDKNKLLSTGLKFDGVDDFAQTSSLRSPLSEMTLCTVVNVNEATANVDVITWFTHLVLRVTKNDGVTLIDRRRNQDRFTVRYSTSDFAHKTIHVVATLSHNKSEIFLNGVKFAELVEPLDGSTLINNNMMLGTFGTGYTKFKLYSTKIYNRPLTPKEIAHNYAIEKERFSIE